MNMLVSVIICTHNRKPLVSRAVDSVLNQKKVEIELIVVDDCSSDGTYKYLEEKYNDKIKVVSTGNNSGRASATNVGYRLTKGKYIALLDDDDYWVDDCKIYKQVSEMESWPELGVLGTWWVEVEGDGRQVKKKPVAPQDRYFLIEKLLMGGGVVCGSTPLISREAWDAVGGMDEKQVKGIDSDLFRRVGLAGYEVSVLEDVTTVVDVSHGFERMTPSKNIKAKIREARGNARVLKKHIFTYFFFPRALYVRMCRILRALYGIFKSRFV